MCSLRYVRRFYKTLTVRGKNQHTDVSAQTIRASMFPVDTLVAGPPCQAHD